jgi:FkbM family methyltransferase
MIATHTPDSTLARPPRTSATLRHTVRYLTRFGWKGGIQAARVRAHATDPLTVRLPELRHPLWVRPGTSDVATFDEVFVAREYDIPLEEFVPQTILDLGANVGFASVQFANRWPAATILAVEPEAENVVMLKRNTGHYRNVDALHAAVWSRSTDLGIENPSDAANAFRMTETGASDGARIPAFTVAQLIDRLGTDRVDLLKMDVEGAEREILRNAQDWIDRVNVLVIELHDRFVPGCAEALYDAVRGRHFRQEIVGQNLVLDLRASQ